MGILWGRQLIARLELIEAYRKIAQGWDERESRSGEGHADELLY